jgi:hypothetical protein
MYRIPPHRAETHFFKLAVVASLSALTRAEKERKRGRRTEKPSMLYE